MKSLDPLGLLSHVLLQSSTYRGYKVVEKSNEILKLQIGVSSAATNRCVEHDIGPDGSLIDNALKQKQKSDSKDVFFDESEEEKFIPRALSI